MVFTTEIAYVQFECTGCNRLGGLAITESEAIALWNGEDWSQPREPW